MALTFTVSAAIVSSSVANPSVITTLTDHGIVSGATVTISGHTSVTPDINGSQVATVTGNKTFTIPVNVTDGGVGGKVVVSQVVQDGSLDISASANTTDSARAKILSATAAFRPAKGQEFIAYENGAAIFGGLIRRTLEEARPNKLSGVDLLHVIESVSFKDYLRGVVINEVIAAGQTLKQILTTNIIPYLSTRGVTLHASQANGPTFADGFEWIGIKASEAVQQLVEASGYDIDVDATKVLRMALPSATAAPYNVTDAVKNFVGDLTVEQSEQEYADRILMHGNGLVKTDTFTGDGVTTAFTLTHRAIGALSLRGYIVYDGVAETLGTGATWTYSVTANTITRNSGAPANTKIVTVVYDVLYVVAEDVPSQTARGYVTERIITKDTFTNISLAELAVAQELTKALSTARTIRFTTRAAGLIRPGQSLTINVANRNINATCTVTDVRLSTRGPQIVERALTCVEGTVTLPTTQRQVLRNWLGGSSDSAPLTADTATAAGCGWHAFDNTSAFAWIDSSDAIVTARGKDGGSNFGAGFPAALASQAKNEGIYAGVFGNTVAGVTKALTILVTDSGGIYIEHDNSTSTGINIYDYAGPINIDAAKDFGIRAGDSGLVYHKLLTGLNAVTGLALGTATLVSSFPYTIDSGLPSGTTSTVFYFAPTANGTVNLPALAGHPVNPLTGHYRTLFLRNTGSFFITLDGNSTETIDGSLTKILCPGQSMILVALTGTGAGWYTLAESQPKSSVTLTNAQVKALPTTAITLIEAPPTGWTIRFKIGQLIGGFASGAYTNVNTANAWIALKMGSTDISAYVPNETALFTELTSFLTTTSYVLGPVLLPLQYTAEGSGDWGLVALGGLGTFDNTALKIYADNNGSGDFTGGHANNTLRAVVEYVVEASA